MKYVNEKLEEFNKFIYDKNIAVISLEPSNLPLLDYLRDRRANVTVFDKRTIDEIEKEVLDKITDRCVKFSFGKNCLINLVGYDIIFCSPKCRPDIPEIKAESLRGAIITSVIEMEMALCPGKVIGVTGSKGTATTAGLIHWILKENGIDSYLEGQFGEPSFGKLPGMNEQSILVQELNEFQLMNIQYSPEIAVITNILKDESVTDNIQLINNETYMSFEEKTKIYKNIFSRQTKKGIVILNNDDMVSQDYLLDIFGQVKYFSLNEKLDNGVILDNGTIKYCEDGVRRHIITLDDAISVSGQYGLEGICAAVLTTIKMVDPKIQARAIIKYRE